MKVSIRSALSELGDVTNPNWPSPETLERYDDMNRSDFWLAVNGRRRPRSCALNLRRRDELDEKAEVLDKRMRDE